MPGEGNSQAVKLETVAETSPFCPSLALRCKALSLLLHLLPGPLLAQVVLLKAVVPWICSCHSASLPTLHHTTASLLLSDMEAKAEPAASAWAGAADPWVPVTAASREPLSQASSSSQQTSAGSWDFPSGNTAASDPWGKVPLSSGFPPADPWVAASPPAQVSGSTPAIDPWAAVAEQPPNSGKRPDGCFGFAEDDEQCHPSPPSCKWAPRVLPLSSHNQLCKAPFPALLPCSGTSAC